jgi:hypothetical protein
MSKKLLIIITALVISNSARAGLSPISFGVKGGLGLGKLSQEGISSDFKLNYLIGAGVDVGVGPVGALVDVLYAKRMYDGGSNTSISMNRLEIPVQGRFSMGLLRVQGGVFWAKTLGDMTFTDANGTDTSLAPAAANSGTTDLGLVLGLGATLPMLSLEARYLFGTKNLSTATGVSTKTSSFEVLAGFWF